LDHYRPCGLTAGMSVNPHRNVPSKALVHNLFNINLCNFTAMALHKSGCVQAVSVAQRHRNRDMTLTILPSLAGDYEIKAAIVSYTKQPVFNQFF